MAKQISIIAIILIAISACDPTEVDELVDSNKIIVKKQIINSKDIEESKILSQLTDNSVSFADITNLYGAIEYRLKMGEYNNEISALIDQKHNKEYLEALELRKHVLKIYNEYSNRWDQIPNDYERYKVRLLIEDESWTAELDKTLYNANDPEVVRRITHRNGQRLVWKKEYDKALDVFNRGITSLENRLKEDNPDELLSQLSTLYEFESYVYSATGDLENRVKSLEKCVAILNGSQKFMEFYFSNQMLAAAYCSAGQKDKAIISMENGFEALKKLKPTNRIDELKKLIELNYTKSMLERLRNGGTFFSEGSL